MKIGHTSDLHLGRQMHQNPLEKDQKHILGEILKVVEENDLDVLVIAGDVYDSVHPPKYAVTLLNKFLAAVPEKCQVVMTPGNHDLQELVGYGDGWAKNIHPVGRYDGNIEPITISDEYGDVNFYPVPFVRPHEVKMFHKDKDIETLDDAFRTILEDMGYDKEARNVLILHQNVLNLGGTVELSGSEDSIIGGEDPLSASVLKDFDYVALGHIHKARNIGSDSIRYCGTPMIYDIDELGQDKGMTILDLGPKGEKTVSHVSLKPLRQVRLIRGNIDELISQADEIGFGDIVYAVLTEHTSDAAARLSKHCDIFHVSHEYTLDGEEGAIYRNPDELSKMDPTDLFCEFFKSVTKNDISAEEREVFLEAVRSVNGGDAE